MDVKAIKSNSVFIQYWPSDGILVFQGAVSVGGTRRNDLIEETLDAIRTELKEAYARWESSKSSKTN